MLLIATAPINKRTTGYQVVLMSGANATVIHNGLRMFILIQVLMPSVNETVIHDATVMGPI